MFCRIWDYWSLKFLFMSCKNLPQRMISPWLDCVPEWFPLDSAVFQEKENLIYHKHICPSRRQEGLGVIQIWFKAEKEWPGCVCVHLTEQKGCTSGRRIFTWRKCKGINKKRNLIFHQFLHRADKVWVIKLFTYILCAWWYSWVLPHSLSPSIIL